MISDSQRVIVLITSDFRFKGARKGKDNYNQPCVDTSDQTTSDGPGAWLFMINEWSPSVVDPSEW